MKRGRDKRVLLRALVLIATTLSASACVAPDPAWVSIEGREAVGSPGELPGLPRSSTFPSVPPEALRELRAGMTTDEAIALLGPPDRKAVQMQDVDRGTGVWNAWVWTWLIQDEIAHRPLPRELELRFAFYSAHDHAVGRIADQGPVWVLTGWDLW